VKLTFVLARSPLSKRSKNSLGIVKDDAQRMSFTPVQTANSVAQI
jgi:hypothetical protein